jgi:hypothetical protein
MHLAKGPGMKSIACIAFCGFALASLPALGASDDSKARSASTDDSTTPRKAERDGKIPAQHKDPESRGELPPPSASAGSSAETSAPGGTDLGVEAEMEDKEIRKNLGKPSGNPRRR